MHNFFDLNLFQQIASGLVVLFVSILLANKTAKTSVSGKGWKVVIIISWMMIISGFYLVGLNAPNGGLNNPSVGLGLSLIILGIPLKYIGKFFHWWHH